MEMGLISGESTAVLWKPVWNILDGRFKPRGGQSRPQRRTTSSSDQIAANVDHRDLALTHPQAPETDDLGNLSILHLLRYRNIGQSSKKKKTCTATPAASQGAENVGNPNLFKMRASDLPVTSASGGSSAARPRVFDPGPRRVREAGRLLSKSSSERWGDRSAGCNACLFTPEIVAARSLWAQVRWWPPRQQSGG
jgi:hypothetical protein